MTSTGIPARSLNPAGFRSLDIMAVVHETATGETRGAYFRQWLLNGATDERAAIAAQSHGVPAAALQGHNFVVSGDRAYAQLIVQNNQQITNLAALQTALDNGNFSNL